MTALEIIALVFIAFFIIKSVTLLVKPTAWSGGPGKQLSGNQSFSYAFDIIVGALMLYFLIAAGLSIVQIFVAVMLGTIITMLSLTPYTPSLLREIGSGEDLLRRSWPGVLVTVALMVGVLWEIFR